MLIRSQMLTPMSICQKLFIGLRNPATAGTIALILWEDLYTINSPQTLPDAHMLMALQGYARLGIITAGLELVVQRAHRESCSIDIDTMGRATPKRGGWKFDPAAIDVR